MTEPMKNQFEEEQKAAELNLDPLMQRSFSRLLGEVPKRVLTMLMKMLSLKGIAFTATCYLVMSGYLDSWAFVVITLVLIFGEKMLPLLKDLRK